MALLDDLDRLGLIQLRTELGDRLAQGPITVYYGCDPTADSLHVGNLIGLLVLRRFQDAGHRPVALAGGATGMIGDPSGRSEERNLLDEETLGSNVARIKEQIARVVDAELVDNHSWTRDLTLLAFLRDVGKHMTINQMIARESVRARLESEHGISYTEFSYMLLQAHDYLWLHDHLGCELQIGGSDQWGNILSGVDLIRRTRGAAAHGLAWPLLTDAGGSKLGKTSGARVWLAADRTSPYQFFQHFMHVDDAELRLQLAMFTLLGPDDVDAVVADHEVAPEQRAGQRRLAREVTTIVHGADAATAAEAASQILFGGSIDGAGAAGFEVVAQEVATTVVAPGRVDEGLLLVELLVETALAGSKGEARRLLAQNGVRVNGEVAGDDRVVGTGDLLHGRWVLLRRGKDRYHLVAVAPGGG